MKILHLEDNAMDAELVGSFLRDEWPNCEISVVDTGPDFEAELLREPHDVIVSDFSLATYTGLEGLKLAQQLAPDTPFIFFSGTIREDVAISAVRDGAADYVLKERPKRLTTAIRHALLKSEERQRRREAEAAEKRSERRFRQLVEQASDAVFVFDSDGKFHEVNRQACNSLGYTQRDLLRCRAEEIDHDFFSAKSQSARATALTGRAVTLLGRHFRKDGSSFPVESRLGRFEIEGEFLFMALVRDITSREEAERRIREQNDLLNQARDAIIVTDLTSRVLYWNQGAERLLGWSAVEAYGMPLETFEGLTELDARKHAGLESDWRGSIKVNVKDGRTLTLETHSTLVRDDAGNPKARMSISSDVTEKIQLRENSYRTQRLESLGMLAAGIAHDLNNVLAPVRMAPALLRDSVTEPNDIKLLDVLEASGERGTQLVLQICRFAKGAGGEQGPIQIKYLLRDLTHFIEQTFPRTIVVEQNIESELWRVTGSATQIHQVLLNLCINARDAMPSGGSIRLRAGNVSLNEAAAATIHGGKTGDWLVLEVEDTGTGIPPEVMKRIWEPFFTTKGPGKGTGLGLSTVRGIVENHGGFVTLKTELGKGTKFSIYLPATPPSGVA